MSITNPFSIQWGSVTAGGASAYHLHNPYVISKDFTTLRVQFDVVVIGTDHSDLKTKCESLEAEFRKRDQTLIIKLGSATWTYTAGTDILNSTATCTKSGDPASDKGVSRKYSCTVTAELPADDNGGLRDVNVAVKYEPGRQKIVSMNGVYTKSAGVSASATYLAGFDSVASTMLSAIDGSASFELVDENYTRDRTNSICQFTRQYVALLADQAEGSRDSNKIRGHKVVFTNLSSHPGDSQEDVYRLRRVQCAYDAYIDITVGTDLHSVCDDVVLPFLRKQFKDEFDPQVYAIEDKRVQYDETAKRLGAMVTYVYQPKGGHEVVEVSIQKGYRENRQIDYTWVHDGDELSAYADAGFLTLERVTTRTVIVIGEESPRKRLSADDDKGKGPAGSMNIEAPQKVAQDGWNRVSNTSTTTPQFIGEPGNDQQIRLTVLSETVVERYNKKPANTGGAGPVITPGEPAPDKPGGGATTTYPGGAITPGA